MKDESKLVRKIILAVRKRYPRAWVRKLADRFTRGLPDLVIIYPMTDKRAGILLVETKIKGGKLSRLQVWEKMQVAMLDLRNFEYLVATSVGEVLDELAVMGTK